MKVSGAVAALGIAALIVAISACKPRRTPTEEERRRAAVEQASITRSWAEGLAERLMYFRDPKSGLCFAYLYVSQYDHSNSATGGPALDSVECAKVEHLLVNGTEAVSK